MRVSRALLTIIAESGDQEAQAILHKWEQEDKTDRKSEVHFHQIGLYLEESSFFLQVASRLAPRTLTAGGIGTPTFNHIPTLTGIRSGAGLYSHINIQEKK